MAASGDGAIDAASGAATGGVADSPAAASLAGQGISGIGDLGPAVRRFVQHQLVQVQAGAEAVFIGGLQDVEGDLRQVFDGRDAVDDDGLVVGQRGQEIAHRVVLFVDQEGVVPDVDQMFLGQRLDVGEVHDHAVVGIAFDGDDLAGQRDFQRVAVAVQVAALAFVVGNPVAGVEFELACDGQHYGICKSLWVCRLSFHFGLRLQVSIASVVLKAASGPSIGWTKKLSKSRPSYAARSCWACGITTLISLPLPTTSLEPIFGLTQIQSTPAGTGKVPLVSMAISKPTACIAAISSRSSCSSGLPPASPSVPTKSVSQNWQTALARSLSRPVHRLQPAKRQNTAGRPA